MKVPADWPKTRAVWTEVNVWPAEDKPHPDLLKNLAEARAWKGIATHWIIVNHHTRVDTPTKRKLFWGHAQNTLQRLGITLVPGFKVHDEFHPWTIEQINKGMKTSGWGTRLVDEADLLHREFGLPIIATDWEGFNKLATLAHVYGDDFNLVRPAFERAAITNWRFWHWYPGLQFSHYDYRVRPIGDEPRAAARIRWNIARSVFNSPRDRLLTSHNYHSVPTWSTATETNFDPAVERERSFQSLGIHNTIEGFTCASQHTLHDDNPILRYLHPIEIVEMPAWKHSDEAFLYVPRGQLASVGRVWQRQRQKQWLGR